MSQSTNQLPKLPQATVAPTDTPPSRTKVNITPTTLNGPIFWRWYFHQWEALALAELARREQDGEKDTGNRTRTVETGQ